MAQFCTYDPVHGTPERRNHGTTNDVHMFYYIIWNEKIDFIIYSTFLSRRSYRGGFIVTEYGDSHYAQRVSRKCHIFLSELLARTGSTISVAVRILIS